MASNEPTTNEASRGKRKQRGGVVVSVSPDKTAVVRVDRRAAHPLYGKVLTQRKKYYAHDENNETRVGDHVSIMETRPYSKKKRWRICSINKRGESE